MKKLIKYAALSAIPATMLGVSAPASAGPNDYLGEVSLVGYTFCPRGTFGAEGQLLPISQWQALFSLYGTQFGGDGRTTFGLPDLRGRTVVGFGNGPGLTPRIMGQKGGAEQVTLTPGELPGHSHTGEVRAENTANADTGNPKDNAIGRTTTPIYSDTATPTANGALHPDTLHIDVSGGGNQPHFNMQPFQVLRYCVANTGVFPSRN